MPLLTSVVVFATVFVPVWWFVRSVTRPYVVARGLVLNASRMSLETTDRYGRRCETRLVRLDVEPRHGERYEVTTNVNIPTFCEALPGTTLDLLVQPTSTANVIVVGPAGCTDWIYSSLLQPQLPLRLWRPKSRAMVVVIPLVVAGSVGWLTLLLLVGIRDG